jgi:UDP-glucose 4-epimerase
VTGGSGFIGAWIIRRLLTGGHDVRVFDINKDRSIVRSIAGKDAENIDWCAGDIRDGDSVIDAAQGCDTIIHPCSGSDARLPGTAALWRGDHCYRDAERLRGRPSAPNVEDRLREQRGRLRPEGWPHAIFPPRIMVRSSLRPRDAPGLTSKITEFPALASVPSLSMAPAASSALLRAQALPAVQRQREDPTRSPTQVPPTCFFVDDVAAAFEAAMQRPIKGAYAFNLVGEVATVDQVIAGIRRHVPEAALAESGPTLPTMSPESDLNLASVLGDLPHTTLSDGLARTIAFYRQT